MSMGVIQTLSTRQRYPDNILKRQKTNTCEPQKVIFLTRPPTRKGRRLATLDILFFAMGALTYHASKTRARTEVIYNQFLIPSIARNAKPESENAAPENQAPPNPPTPPTPPHAEGQKTSADILFFAMGR